MLEAISKNPDVFGMASINATLHVMSSSKETKTKLKVWNKTHLNSRLLDLLQKRVELEYELVKDKSEQELSQYI